jgi:hypothetical protein
MWKANKFVNILLWVLAIASVGVCAYTFLKCGNIKADVGAAEKQEIMLAAIDPLLVWSYILVGITAVVAVFLPLPQVVQNPKSALGILVGLVAFVVVIGLAYAFASGAPLTFTPGHPEVSEGTIKFTDVNLIAVYIMLGATILVTLATSILNFVKLR